jgi:replicative superfamily II helicase
VEDYGDWHVSILTYERFSSLLNKEKKRTVFNNLGVIIIDEVHNFGNNSRGATLESAIIKLRILFPNVKIIGLSATIDNPEEFSEWLNTKLVRAQKSERPVPLELKVLTYQNKYNGHLNLMARVDLIRKIKELHPNKTMLVFVTSRARTQQVAKELARNKHMMLKEALYNHKIGWHNAGMKIDEKNKVEKMFREGKINTVVCTPTLAMGVNLPADICVIFDMYQWSYLTGRSIIEKDRLEQTIGRAGRPGLSDVGYAYILCSGKEKQEVMAHIQKPLRVESQLRYKMKEKLLEWIVAKILVHKNKINKLLSYVIDKENITKRFVVENLIWLKDHGFVKVIDGEFIPTFKGRMTAYQCIQPETVVHWEDVLKIEKLSNAELFCMITSAQEYAKIVVPYRNDKTKIDYAEQYVSARDEVIRKFHQEIQGVLVDFTEHIYKIFALTFSTELMSKYGVDKKNFNMSYGDKYVVSQAAKRYLTATKILFGKDYSDQLTDLLVGSTHSIIKGDVIELAKVKGIGNVRLSQLMNNGIDSVEKLLSTTNKKLMSILKLREESIKKLKISLVEFL